MRIYVLEKELHIPHISKEKLCVSENFSLVKSKIVDELNKYDDVCLHLAEWENGMCLTQSSGAEIKCFVGSHK